MSLHRGDARVHYYNCDVCGKREKAYFFGDVHDHLPADWVHLSRRAGDCLRDYQQQQGDLFLCPAHAKDQGLVRLMLRLAADRVEEQATQ